MKKLYPLFFILFLLSGFQAFAQRPTNLTNWLVYSKSGTPYGSIWATDMHGRKVMLVDSAQLPRTTADGKFLLYTRQDGNASTNLTGWVAKMDMATGAKADLFRFNDWTVGYDMLLRDSTIITGYSCAISLITFTGAGISTPVNGDCFDDAPVLRQRDSMLVYHNLNQGIKLHSLPRGNMGILPNTRPGDYWPQWSPDGNWILFGRPGVAHPTDPYRYINNLYKIRPDGSGLTRLTKFPATDTSRFGQNFAWSQDGSQVFACGVPGPNKPYALIAIMADSSGRMDTVMTVPNATVSFLHGRPANHTFTATRPQLAARPLRLYPNPATGTVSVQLPSAAAGAAQIRVLDAAGRTILQQSASGNRINLPIGGLRAGIYRVEAKTGQSLYGGRLTVE